MALDDLGVWYGIVPGDPWASGNMISNIPETYVTANGKTVEILGSPIRIKGEYNEASITDLDLLANNGVVHAIDSLQSLLHTLEALPRLLLLQLAQRTLRRILLECNILCDLCRNGQAPGNPDEVITIAGVPRGYSCQELYEFGQTNRIPVALCSPIQT